MASAFPSDHDMAPTLFTQMANPQLIRRNSRSSASQPGLRSTRIEKPKSNHNSPRTVEKRRSTMCTKKYATMEDHFNMMFGITGHDDEAQEERREPLRPMSWHPSSTQFQLAPRSSVVVEPEPSQDWSRHDSASSRNSAHGSDFYSLSTRSSFFADRMPNYPKFPSSLGEHRGSQGSESSWRSQNTEACAPSSYSTPVTEPTHMQWSLQEWTRRNDSDTSSANGSSDFLPIQHPGSSQVEQTQEDCDMDEPDKELVGMGLYDLPYQAWNLSSLVEGSGKGLKLEETWQPPEEEDDDQNEAEDDGDEGSSDDGSVEDPLPAAQNASKLPMPDVKAHMSANMQGQSFFFEEDDSYTKEWWFQQLKNPSMPVRDIGWL